MSFPPKESLDDWKLNKATTLVEPLWEIVSEGSAF